MKNSILPYKTHKMRFIFPKEWILIKIVLFSMLSKTNYILVKMNMQMAEGIETLCQYCLLLKSNYQLEFKGFNKCNV